jgi:hypothetical protein
MGFISGESRVRNQEFSEKPCEKTTHETFTLDFERRTLNSELLPPSSTPGQKTGRKQIVDFFVQI